VGIIFIDTEDVVVFTNQAALDILGVKREKIIGYPVIELYRTESRLEVENILQQLKSGRQFMRTSFHCGGKRLINTTFTAVRDEAGNYLGITVNYNDYSSRIHLEEQLAKSHEELKVLYEAGRLFNSSLELPQVLGQVVKVTRDIIPYASCYVYLYDTEKGTFEPAVEVGEGASLDTLRREEIYKTLQQVFKGEVSLYVEGRFSEYFIPIISHGEVMGVFYLVTEEGASLSDDQQALLIGICNQAGLAIRNAKMYEHINHLATIDGLTGLYNRQCFDAIIHREMERANRFGIPLTLLMVDVNGLKYINDHYGHTKGDYIITEAGKILKESVRNVDYVFRYGGDELVVLLLEADEKIARGVLGRIKENCKKWNWQYGNSDLQVSLSIGYATAGTNDGPEDLLMRADHMMYRDKERHYREKLKNLLQDGKE